MKKFVTGLLIGIMLMFSVNAFAKILFVESPKTLFVNGEKVDKPVYILNDETYVPLNELSEAMGAQVKVTDEKISLDTSVLEKVAEKCKDSCVMIYAYMKNGTISQGSGFAYNGYIITAKHVIEGSNKVVFFTDGGGYSNGATIHHVDNHHDLAILKPSVKVPTVTLGDSDKLKDGNKLISITSPYGEVNCMDECIFSGTIKYTTWTGINLTESSTDGGSSGGAVFNLNGELVGMVLNGEGESTGAIPINNIIRTLELRTK